MNQPQPDTHATTLEPGAEMQYAPEGANDSAAHSSVIIALLAAIFIVAACNPSSLRRSIARYRSDLWNVRARRNAFDDDEGAPLPMRVFLSVAAILICGFCGIFAAGATSALSAFAGAGAFAVFYFFDYVAYSIIGYAFTSPDNSAIWRRGFTASIALTGIILFVPLLFILFIPEARAFFSAVCLLVFFFLRIVFICKGFRIFYSGFPSLLYFILYLCTVEIIPLTALWKLFHFLIDASL